MVKLNKQVYDNGDYSLVFANDEQKFSLHYYTRKGNPRLYIEGNDDRTYWTDNRRSELYAECGFGSMDAIIRCLEIAANQYGDWLKRHCL